MFRPSGTHQYNFYNLYVIWSSGKRIATVFTACETISGENRDTELSSGHSLRSFRLTIRAEGSLAGMGTGEVKGDLEEDI